MAGSPWGAIQHSVKLKRGMRLVSTAGHGGIMVTMNFAKNNLTEEAIKRGLTYGNYLCYEEDCDMSIPIFESPDIWEKFGEKAWENSLNSLSCWNADYLIERGIEPISEYYEAYLDRKEYDRLRSKRSSDLIIAASQTETPGLLLVHTADENTHIVEQESYRNQSGKLKLLSNCSIQSL